MESYWFKIAVIYTNLIRRYKILKSANDPIMTNKILNCIGALNYTDNVEEFYNTIKEYIDNTIQDIVHRILFIDNNIFDQVMNNPNEELRYLINAQQCMIDNNENMIRELNTHLAEIENRLY